MEAGGETYRLVTDALGSVLAVVDIDTGEVMQRLRYDSFGRVLEDTSPGFQPIGFAGGLYDPDTGWVHFGARDYRPEVGSWAAKDPIGFAGGETSLYAYVAGDPINLIDPSGLAWYDYFGWVEDLNDSALGQCIIGFGDAVGGIPFTGYNVAGLVRDGLGVNDVVDFCSASYQLGQVAGVVHVTVLQYRGFTTGREFAVGKNFRIAPWGNRTGHPTGRFPHYHRRGLAANGQTKPGQGISRHRPWDRRSSDKTWWERF
jgi:RHS repeat-associated protein